jgi:hypothetical protein
MIFGTAPVSVSGPVIKFPRLTLAARTVSVLAVFALPQRIPKRAISSQWIGTLWGNSYWLGVSGFSWKPGNFAEMAAAQGGGTFANVIEC